jgi:hypothetical protein
MKKAQFTMIIDDGRVTLEQGDEVLAQIGMRVLRESPVAAEAWKTLCAEVIAEVMLSAE